MKHKIGHKGETCTMQKVRELLERLANDGFFGEVGITFQNGKPHTVRVHRTYKIDQL